MQESYNKTFPPTHVEAARSSGLLTRQEENVKMLGELANLIENFSMRLLGTSTFDPPTVSTGGPQGSGPASLPTLTEKTGTHIRECMIAMTRLQDAIS